MNRPTSQFQIIREELKVRIGYGFKVEYPHNAIHELELYLLCNTKGIYKSFNIHYFRHIVYCII